MSSPSGGSGGFMSKLPRTNTTESNDKPKEGGTPDYPNLNKTPPAHTADIETELLMDLTTNPYKQYRSVQNRTLYTPYSNPIDQFKSSPYITGRIGDEASHDSRESVFSAIVSRDEIDSIPPTALFLGRIGQQRPKQLERFVRTTPSQREFFENSGFNDDMIKYTLLPAAFLAGALGVLATPFERARALVQANAASIAALQDADVKNMVGKPAPNQNNPLFNATNNSTSVPEPTPSHPTNPTNNQSDSMTTNVTKKPSPKTTALKPKAMMPTMLQPERKDSFSKFFNTNPNSSKAPILRPNPYDIYARRQILLFEEEYAKIVNDLEYRGMSGFEKALKTKELNPHLHNIHISSYDIFNHHLEHGVSTRTTSADIALDMMTGANKDAGGGGASTQRARLRPMEIDAFPQSQSDLHRGFHRYYAEDRYTNLRSALRAIYKHNGFMGCFRYSLLPFIARFFPFAFLVPFYHPWKDWMTTVDAVDSVFKAEYSLAESHTRSQLLTMLAIYPLYAMMASVHANKTGLYPKYALNSSPELVNWKERFTSFHLLNDTFSKYTTKTPAAIANETKSMFGRFFKRSGEPVAEQSTEELLASIPKYHDDSVNTGFNKQYRAKQVSFLESMLKRELNKSRTKLIVEQLLAIEGPLTFIRGVRPALLTSMLYYIVFVATFAVTGTLTVEFMHEFRSKMKPAPPQGHPHDINLEIAKALVPFTVSTLAAQYLAYPLTTIRQYIIAADSPGYVTFNKHANALPHGIAVDQYRLPFRLVEPVKPRHQFRIASHEIRRQYGFRGFWHGASIIPMVRLPQAILVGGAMFFGLHAQWPAMNQLIDSQHFYNNLPPIM